MNNILLNKSASLERCIKRVQEEYSDFETLKNNQTKQDAIIYNLQHAIQLCVIMSARVISLKRLRLPEDTRDYFNVLTKEGFLCEKLNQKMQKLIEFQYIAIHEFLALDLEIVKSIIENDLSDISEFSKIMLNIQ